MVLAPEYHQFVGFGLEILFVCLLAWFRRFAMAENSIVEAEFKGMSCSTPINPFKPGNPFTPESDSSLDPSKNYFGSSSRRSHSATRSRQRTNWIIIQLICLHTTVRLWNLLKILRIMMALSRYEIIWNTLSVALLLMAVFLAASLRSEAQKVLNGLSNTDCRDYKKIVDKLELRFGVEKQRELHRARLHSRRQQENKSVQALAADIRSMSSLTYQDLSPDTQERFASSISLMPSKIKTTGSDYAEINHAPWMKPCRWLVNLNISSGDSARCSWAISSADTTALPVNVSEHFWKPATPTCSTLFQSTWSMLGLQRIWPLSS